MDSPHSDRPVQSPHNRLLALFEPADRKLLSPHFKNVTLEYRKPLYEAYKPIEHVYFPVTGVASLVNTMANGFASEVGTIGNEGMVGLPLIFHDTMGPTTVYMQVPGDGLQLPARIFRDAIDQSSSMRVVLAHYAHAFFNQVAQSAACNHAHELNQRCCRWLLMTHDRVQSQKFMLTQEFLAMMLGVRRTSVTLAANKLKKLDLIDYNRGHVTIRDRKGLEKLSCECYAVSKHEFDRLLGEPLGAD
ncbi:MAG: Crp/Fnr family transcriptional regulator [Pseudolabrys sp.]|nr:Crp/Fnr family transcriptional regulator [Pseudolabrys sp.]